MIEREHIIDRWGTNLCFPLHGEHSACPECLLVQLKEKLEIALERIEALEGLTKWLT